MLLKKLNKNFIDENSGTNLSLEHIIS